MRKILADVNVLLALSDPEHTAHGKVVTWLGGLQKGDRLLLCRPTQTALLRLLTTSSVMQGKPMTLPQAWHHVDSLLGGAGIGFLREAPGIENSWRSLCQPFASSPKVVADAYLAALAIETGSIMATMDSGFRQFPGLSLVKGLLP